ncbi:hypothetical protein F0U63_48715 [Cystobacter fuscus]|nr:hypothetical protein F0U63_48715 [Cystobacter fuscus]
MSLVIKEATELNGVTFVTGTASTNKTSCFSTGDVSGNFNPTSGATLTAVSDDNNTTINVLGPVANGKITARVEAEGETADCTFQSMSTTFTRQ